MPKENLLPIVWGGWDTIDVVFNQYYDVQFTDDFGVFKKGEKYESLSIDYGRGIIQSYNDDGSVCKTQHYKVIPN